MCLLCVLYNSLYLSSVRKSAEKLKTITINFAIKSDIFYLTTSILASYYVQLYFFYDLKLITTIVANTSVKVCLTR